MRNNALLVAFIFVLLCGVVESLVARHISPDFQYRMTILICLLTGSTLTLAAWLHDKSGFWRVIRAGWPLLLFAILALASTAWSIMPQATFLAALALTFFTLACLSLVALSDWQTLLKGITLACLAIGLLSIALIPVGGLMQELHEGALRGPFSEKNRAGMVYAIGAIASGGLAFTARKTRWLLPIPFFLILLFLSQSGTSTIACALGLAALAYGEMLRGKSSRFILGVWVGVLGAIGIFFLVILNAETILDLLGEDATFTGRDRIWPAVWWRVMENPILGYGYDAYWREGSYGMAWLWYEAGFEVYNAHNGWLETMLAVGLPGVVLLAWVVLRTGIAGLTGLYQVNDARRVAIPMIAMIVMMSLTESAIGGPEGPAWLLLLLISTRVAMKGDRQRAPIQALKSASTRIKHPIPAA
ncbi:MAG: O-antigen ligase family protein [Pseudomonadota bacterium]